MSMTQYQVGYITMFFYAMQRSNTALETTALVMYDPNMFFNIVPLFLMALRISLTYIAYHKHHKHY